MPKAILLLSDGTRWEGTAVGVPGVAVGELSIFTGVADYMRLMTDPSCAGQLVCMTYPSIGNYGVNTEHCETGKPQLRGLIVNELCSTPSNWRSVETVDYFLKRNLVSAISGLDTRSLTHYMAEHGPQNAAICTTPGFTGWDALTQKIRSFQHERQYPQAVSKSEHFTKLTSPFAHVAICDFGSSRALGRLLAELGLSVTLLPPAKLFAELTLGDYDALVMAPGPGLPFDAVFAQELRRVMDSGLPMLGMGLGFMLMADALGARLTPMPLGHRASNLPVRDVRSSRTVITRQNHGFTIAPDSVDTGEIEISHINVNDGTIEGFRLMDRPVTGVQYQPSALTVSGGGLLFAELIDSIFIKRGR